MAVASILPGAVGLWAGDWKVAAPEEGGRRAMSDCIQTDRRTEDMTTEERASSFLYNLGRAYHSEKLPIHTDKYIKQLRDLFEAECERGQRDAIYRIEKLNTDEEHPLFLIRFDTRRSNEAFQWAAIQMRKLFPSKCRLIILDTSTSIEVLDDARLAEVGLQRIEKRKEKSK